MQDYWQQYYQYAPYYAQAAQIPAADYSQSTLNGQAAAVAYGYPGYTVAPVQPTQQPATTMVDEGVARIPAGHYRGTIKSFNADKGWGHIDCPDTFAFYGKDILLLRTEASGAKTGDTVSFTIAEDEKGIKAANVEVLVRDDPSTTPAYMGTMKSFNDDKGWGIIESPDARKVYGKDILVLKTELNVDHPMKGDQVSFSVKQDSRGLKAVNVQLVKKGGVPFSGNVEHKSGARNQTFIPVVQADPNKIFQGAVKAFDEEKGFGFISCDESFELYNKDVFVLRSHMQGQTPAVGDRMEFTVTMGSKGPAAANIKLLFDGGE